MKITNKKIIFLTPIVIFLIILALNSKVFATDEIASGNCGTDIVWSLNSDGILTISGNGSMSGKTCAWSDYKEQVKEVIFNGNITKISERAFEYNTNIEEITLPDSVREIGLRSFAECKKLRSVKTSNQLVDIGFCAFYNCSSLKTMELLSNSVLYVREGAFGECTALDTLTMKIMFASIHDTEHTIPENTTICGFKCSSVYYYAIKHGRKFKDLITGNITQETITNQDYLDALPTSNLQALGPTSHNWRSYSDTVGLSGYTSNFAVENYTSNSDYIAMKALVNELVTNCTTEEEKARAIFSWVTSNITYSYGAGATANMDRIYEIFNKKMGNCEAYTMLTNYMLYLCNIPTATVSNTTHEWSAAFVDGRWIYIDSTHGAFNITTYNRPEVISFAYDGLVYVVDDPSAGGKVTGIAKNQSEIDELISFTIPTNSYMKSIYSTALPTKIELRAEVGTVGAEYVKNNRPYCTIVNNQIIGKNTRDLLGDVNGDEKVSLIDYAMVLAHVKRTTILTEGELARADVNGDGKISLIDYAMILAHVKRTTLLW